jgi:hypothetical protein
MFPRSTLDRIRRGEVRLAFRRWQRPRVRPGTQLRTAIGLVAVNAIETADASQITVDDARLAGFATPGDVREALGGDPSWPVFRVALHFAGADPRAVLREDAALGAEDVARLRERLAGFDAASGRGPWTGAVLALIGANPGVRAADLAARLGRETLAFKRDVRKLKELGLTESLEVGYRLSPRGEACLAAIVPRSL